MKAPSLYDTRKPIDQELSDISLRKNNFLLPVPMGHSRSAWLRHLNASASSDMVLALSNRRGAADSSASRRIAFIDSSAHRRIASSTHRLIVASLHRLTRLIDLIDLIELTRFIHSSTHRFIEFIDHSIH
ncbi:Acetylcholine receptor subunit beta-like 2 [Gryllus bimaculatus]|nr:Acetylcholine receptor subunit beta-like 2 [Gryllus bimaculatus]